MAASLYDRATGAEWTREGATVHTPTQAMELMFCPRHPGERILDSCERCGDFLCLSCVGDADGPLTCAACTPPRQLPKTAVLRRLFAAGIDSALMFGALMVAIVLRPISPALASVLVWTLIAANVFMLRKQGQSFGRMLAGTRVVTLHDGPIAWWQALARAPLLIVPLLGPLFAVAFSLVDGLFMLAPSQRALHDLAARTRVIDEGSSNHVYRRS